MVVCVWRRRVGVLQRPRADINAIWNLTVGIDEQRCHPTVGDGCGNVRQVIVAQVMGSRRAVLFDQ